MNHLQMLEMIHQDAMAEIESFRYDQSEPEMQANTEYLLVTDVNPYYFLPVEQARLMSSSSGVVELLHMIHRAIFVDGNIRFPIVKGQPRIVFGQPTEYSDAATECKNIVEFVEMHRAYFSNEVQSCFIYDVARRGWEYAIDNHRNSFVFDPEWQYDENVLAQVQLLRDRSEQNRHLHQAEL